MTSTTVRKHPRKKPSGGTTTVKKHNRTIHEGQRVPHIPEENLPTFRINRERNGVELRFEEIPSPEIRDLMKSYGFRGSRYNKVWWAHKNDTTHAFAFNLSRGKMEEIAEIPIPSPETIRQAQPRRSKAKKFKYMILYKRKRKPKNINEDAANYWLKNPASAFEQVNKIFKYPAGWNAEEARRKIAINDPDVSIIMDKGITKAAQQRAGKVPIMIAKINKIHGQYPPHSYRVTIQDERGNSYKFSPRRNTLDRITGRALTEGRDVPVETIAQRSNLFIRVQEYGTGAEREGRRGVYLRPLGRIVKEEEL
jgi:hypothetical protein